MLNFLLSLFLSVGATSVPDHELSFGQHYQAALLSRAAGAGIGLAFGGIGGFASRSPAPVALGIVGGSLLGAAYGANTATALEEANGSFLLGLAGAAAGDAAGIGAGLGLGRLVEGEHQGWISAGLAFAGWFFLEPLGAVALQRWSSGRALPELSLWTPRGPDFQPGLVATWSFR